MKVRVVAITVISALVLVAAPGPTPAAAEPTPPESAPFDSWADAAATVPEQLLAKTPPAADLQADEAALAAGTLTPGTLVARVRATTDQTAMVDPAARLYRAFFLRIPDKNGLEYWIRARRTGSWTLVRMAAQFAASSEFTNRYGQLTNRAFVELIYANVLQRPPDQGGVDYWTRQLDQRRRSRGSVMVGFSESNEYRSGQASEVTTAVLWILLVGRAPTSVEYAAGVAALDSGQSVADFATELMGHPDYAARLAKQRLAVFGDSVPYDLLRDGAASTDLSAYTLVNATTAGCDGAANPPPSRWRLGPALVLDAACLAGWPSMYPPHLAIRPDLSVLSVGPHGMLDHKFDGVWHHPCDARSRDWYRNDLVDRLEYLASTSDRVVLVLPAWPAPNSVWIMPDDFVARADCVREEMAAAAAETQTPTIDLGAHVCPTDPSDCLPYRTTDGIHIDAAQAPATLQWLLTQLPA